MPLLMACADDCLGQGSKDALTNGVLVCQYFTSGSMVPADVPSGPGVGRGDYAIRFASVSGSPWISVRIPCASYALRVTIVGQAITPDPGTLESFVAPAASRGTRMAIYLQDPLQFVQRETGIVLQNPEWGVTLFDTPYDAD
ncbi:hypothetical protein [Pseudarthrobacter sp. MDT1-22]